MAFVKVQIAAQVAQDAMGVPYRSYLIPEPKSYQAWREGMRALNSRPRADIGIEPDAQPPVKYTTIELVRGAPPIELELSEELLEHLKSDKKNLLVFGITKADGTKVEEPKAETVVSRSSRNK
jgi:hypothetical protein